MEKRSPAPHPARETVACFRWALSPSSAKPAADFTVHFQQSMRTLSADWLRGRRWLLAGLACLAARACDGFAVFVVPADMRAQGAREIEHRTRFVSLDSLFPEAGGRLCDRWDEDDQLRSAVRAAGREDFYEDDPRFDEKRLRALRAIARDPATSLQGRWRRERPFPALTSALAANGFSEISGDVFVSRIASLCTSDGGKHTFGSWMDIVGRPRGSDHAWHQDSGLVQDTAMLGFPSENGFEGEGVFSHVIHLSHHMPEPGQICDTYVRRYKQMEMPETGPCCVPCRQGGYVCMYICMHACMHVCI